jgi:hypothetical protein
VEYSLYKPLPYTGPETQCVNVACFDLEKWNGGKAKLWNYDVSFSTLVIRVEKENVKGNLHIRCRSCLSIIAPKLSWKNCHLKLEIIDFNEYLGATFLLWDENEGIKIPNARIRGQQKQRASSFWIAAFQTS